MEHRLQDSNIGVTGPASVRLGGKRIENLPIAEGARAKEQLPAVYEADRQSKIEAVKARFPRASVLYLESRVKECQENIERVHKFRGDQQSKISEYTSQLAMCGYREKEIAAIPSDDPDREEKIKDLKKRFPLYDVGAMKAQITQFEEGCKRCDSVIDQEHQSIAELKEVIGRCKQRDLELKNLGE